VLGRTLNAYAAAGIGSDHEAYTADEGRERLRAGMWLLIREATAARNLQALLPLLAEYGPGRIAFCTDDREPEHIAADGHINGMVRDAVAFGIPPEDALVCASLNPALWHGLQGLGAIAPGYRADILVLPDLDRFVPDVVLKNGAPVEEFPRATVPDWVRHTVRIGAFGPEMFRLPFDGGEARVIGVIPGQIVTDSLVATLPTRAGEALPDPERDLAKIAVVERHLGTGRVGLGFVQGFGLKRGAIGSTVAHDAHNVVVVGMNDASMAAAVRRLANRGGGIVVVDGAEVLAELPLPVAGLLSDEPLEHVVEAAHALAAAAREIGCTLDEPFQHLSFLALSVIPSLKLTDRGLVDVDRFALVELRA
jgi:adenine deaminase